MVEKKTNTSPGRPPPDRNRDPPVNPPVRNVAHAATHLHLPTGHGAVRHADEVFIQRHGAGSAVTGSRGAEELRDVAAGGRVLADWIEGRCW